MLRLMYMLHGDSGRYRESKWSGSQARCWKVLHNSSFLFTSKPLSLLGFFSKNSSVRLNSATKSIVFAS